MDNINIKVIKTHPDAKLPAANNKEAGEGDTGYDLVAVEGVKLAPGGSNVVAVGLTLADITPGYWLRIEPRSGLGFKHSIQPHLGVIDNGYRGDLGVKLYNFGIKAHHVKKGDKIAQLVVYKLNQPVFEFTDEVTLTNRGEKGFGSSDKPRPPLSDLTRPPFAKLTSVKYKKSQSESFTPVTETATDNSSTVVNVVNAEGEVDEQVHGTSNLGGDVNPWKFNDVQALMDWAKVHRDVVDDDYFADLLGNTIRNREELRNV